MAKGDETRSNYVFAWGRQGNGAELKTRRATHAISDQSRSRSAKALALNKVYTLYQVRSQEANFFIVSGGQPYKFI